MQVLIVDTDKEAADLLRGQLAQITDSQIRWTGKAAEALFDVEEGRLCPDVCFMDLSVSFAAKAGTAASGLTGGIGLAARLLQTVPDMQMIFTIGGWWEHGVRDLDVYEVEHVWMLRKPVDPMLLRRAWQRALDHRANWEQENFTFRFDRKIYRVPLRDILYFEKDRRRVILHLVPDAAPAVAREEKDAPGKEHRFYAAMDEVMAQLDHRFLRCHNSYIVNLDRVCSWTKTAFTMGRKKIPISRRYAEEAQTAFAGEKKV